MQVTEVRIRLPEFFNNHKFKAYADITLDDILVIKSLKVIEGATGLFVQMPQTRLHNGKYMDLVFPIRNSLRMEIEKAIFEKYQQRCKETVTVGVK